MRSARTWALVMNGVRARILRGLEDTDGEDQIEIVHRAASMHLRDVLTDRAGRSFSSGSGGRRSAMEPGTDPILRDMQDFASDICEVLEQHRKAGAFARLAILVEPRMLGILRARMPAPLHESVVLERPMNLVALPEKELRERVLDLVRNKA
ncbi:host attachment protein [Oceaniglobus roseus]|uniref:host attachment protein n=1 Tax=Oceaniglobus roseus TaxID=1737570 RepID=UPI000C7F74C6|nr:host attachment protein [Kandeliimicrobium roseum]